MQTLIIDNYDSYTFNLYQLIAEVNGKLPLVIQNDRIEWEDLKQLAFDNIVISPGPGRPEKSEDFGVCRSILENTHVPLLGVCLGHQGLGYVYGGKVIHAPEVRHGRLSKIYHQGSDLFKGIPSPFSVVRYHSLLVADDLPSCLEKTAWTEDGLVMGLRHRHLPLWGVQFHPESICTEYGRIVLKNFRDLTRQFATNRSTNSRKQKRIELTRGFPSSTDREHQEQKLEFELCTRKIDKYPDSEQLFFHLFADSTTAFWLDSSWVEPGLSRFSFMGDGSGPNSFVVRYHTQTRELIVTQSDIITRSHESIFDYLKREIESRSCSSEELPFDFNCGFVGYLGYEMKAECGAKDIHHSSLPDAMFLFADRTIAFDRQEETLYLLCWIEKGQTAQAEAWFQEIQSQLDRLVSLPKIVPQPHQNPVVFRLSRSHSTYLSDIHQCLQEIEEGETYQVCLTNQIYTEATPDPLSFYRILRQINPAPYSAFFRFSDLAIACSSPERFLRIDRQNRVETKPIKGTRRRGQTKAEDFMLREQLRNSEKERAENLMIVDLLRNDLGRVCEVGSVCVSKLMEVETYATVHQLVTTIQGRLPRHLQAVDCVRAAFPGGSMTGAPKIRTLQIIDRLEQEARGIYSGAIGFFGLNGSADLNIAIRTAILTPKGTSIGVGGGIVALSDPELEYQEMLLKAQALVQAIVLTMHGTFDPDKYRILGAEPTTCDRY
ncbi:MAG: aminodeoxychorismate synthase component I [Geitlerinemataceae cyanobacterium]